MPYREEKTKRVVYWLGEKGSGFKPRSLNGYQDITKIKATCRAKGGVLFEDVDFPANEASIGTADAANYVWKRPFEIVPEGQAPEFIVGEADRFDIRQGKIGNCWFLAAVTDLTLNKDLLEFTLTSDNSLMKKYCGAFHFRFWQYGKWIDVVVDDRLPCKKKNGKLAFMHSEEKNEFWGALLEKAFAKLNGSYKAIEGGFTFQGLQDFTGGITEIYLLDLPELIKNNIFKNESDMFDSMVKYYTRSSFMGSSVKAHKNVKERKLANGLIQGHAYSITDLRRIETKLGDGSCIELVRLRNPWGNAAEWNGDFSDNSSAWEDYFEPHVRIELGVTWRADGEFWMTFTDYLEQFDRIEICHSFNLDESYDEEGTTKLRDSHLLHIKHGHWTVGSTAGGPFILESYVNPAYETNPQYLLTIIGSEPQLVLVCLMKNDRKAEGSCAVKRFSFDIFDISAYDAKTLPTPLNLKFFEANDPIPKFNPPGGPREVTIRFNLNPGKYVIIPSTNAPDCPGNFLLRIITPANTTFMPFDKTLDYIGEEIEIEESTEEELKQLEKYKELFVDVAEDNGQVDWWELKMLLDKSFHAEFRYEGFGFSEDQCRSMIALYDGECSGELGFFEFMKLWLNIKKWKVVFEKYAESSDKTGGSIYIRTPKLDDAFSEAGYSVSKEVLTRIVLRHSDRKGNLWLGQFISAAVKLEAVFGNNLCHITIPEYGCRSSKYNINDEGTLAFEHDVFVTSVC